jgi:hypothetical protein
MNTIRIALILTVLAFARSASAASTFIDATVLQLEANPMPGGFYFLSSQNPPPGSTQLCTANSTYSGTSWLWYSSATLEQSKAELSVVLSAYLSGKTLHITFDTTTCQILSIRAI